MEFLKGLAVGAGVLLGAAGLLLGYALLKASARAERQMQRVALPIRGRRVRQWSRRASRL